MKSIFSKLKYVLFLGAGVFLVWWSIHSLPEKDWQDCKNALTHARYYLFIPVFFILVASHWSRARRWQLLMEPLGRKPDLINTFFAVMIGYLVNLAIPRLGEVVKCTVLAKYEKVKPEKIIGTIVIERTIDLFCLILVFLVALLVEAKVIGAYAWDTFHDLFMKNNHFSYVKLTVILGSITAVVLILRYILVNYAHIHFIDKLKTFIHGIGEGFTTIKKMKGGKEFIFHSVFIWCCYLGGTYLGFYAIKETQDLPLMATFPVLAFASIGMILAPGGIGFYPYFIKKVMLLYGIEEGIGFANGNLQWIAQFSVILLIGFISLILLPWYNKKIHHAAN